MSAPLILGTNSIKDVGYNVDNSLRFDDGSSDHLSQTLSSSYKNTWTWSGWVKRANLTTSGLFNNQRTDNNVNSRFKLFFNSSNQLQWEIKDSTGNDDSSFKTNRLFRDVSAWYHVVFIYDTTDATAGDRLRLYINGVRETSFASEDQAGSNFGSLWSSSLKHYVGVSNDNSGLANYFDGYMTEVVFIDGTALEPTNFGEFDEDSSVWKPIDVSGLTFGSDGYYLDFEDSSALGNDVSGNNNDFTVNNLTSVDQSTDTCTNNYATLNPLHQTNASSNYFLEEGNLQLNVTNNDFYRQTGVTIHPTNFKGYFEFKNTSQVNFILGFQNTKILIGKNNYQSTSTPDFYYLTPPHIRYGNGGSAATLITDYVGTISEGDIVGCAFDFTGSNKNVWFHVNGTYGNNGSGVGNPSTGANPALTATQLTADEYEIIMCINTGGGTCTVDFNFGSPNYSESGGNSDDAGYGNFNQTVPTGFHALNTKNLAEYG